MPAGEATPAPAPRREKSAGAGRRRRAGGTPAGGPSRPASAGTVVRRLFSGSASTYFVDCTGREMKAIVQRGGGADIAVGSPVALDWDPADLIPLPAA